MNLFQKLWYYCPKPLKRRSHFFMRLAITLHLPRLDRLARTTRTLGLVSLLISVSLFYFGTVSFATLATGVLSDIRVYLRNPLHFLLSAPIFIGIWTSVHSILSVGQKKGSKVLIFAILMLIIVPSGFAISLASGLLDSITLSGNSVLDLYQCTAFLNIENTGLKDVQITRITIGNFVCNLPRPHSSWDKSFTLDRWKSNTLEIFYTLRGAGWGTFSIDPFYSPTDVYVSNEDVTPTTFHEGVYPLEIQTQGLKTFRFEIVAEFSKREEIRGIRAGVINLGNRRAREQGYCIPDIGITLDMPPHRIAFVYSVDIGNLTLTFRHPLIVGYNGFMLFDLYYSFRGENYYYEGGSYEKAIPNQDLSLPLFKVGETYNLTLRTMENNNYTASITMTK